MTKKIKLSKRAEKRYLKIDKDFKAGKNVKSFSSVNELVAELKQV